MNIVTGIMNRIGPHVNATAGFCDLSTPEIHPRQLRCMTQKKGGSSEPPKQKEEGDIEKGPGHALCHRPVLPNGLP
jgi:hypothetical protein